MPLFNDRQKAVAREMIALGDLEGEHPEDWAERLEALARQAGAGGVIDAIAPYAPLIGRALELYGDADEPARLVGRGPRLHRPG
jgi:hypothetical protein